MVVDDLIVTYVMSVDLHICVVPLSSDKSKLIFAPNIMSFTKGTINSMFGAEVHADVKH